MKHDAKWIMKRLRAMDPQEILWRMNEKWLQQKEKNRFYVLQKPVTDVTLSSKISCLHIDIDKLPINWKNNNWTTFSSLDLLGVFDYDDYKDKWNVGFQTDNSWPEEPFSPTISINQRVDIGDIRMNWELNRHFQFAALAKSYYCTKDERYLSELKRLFASWNRHNLFLHGVEWTSAMELAIRVNSWVYTFAFLKKAECVDDIMLKLEHGILVMADYVMKHRSRFSSANNHLIVEMYAVALTGILTGYSPWKNEALKILTEELPKQNYADGVNKEMSLHYQSFVMEAYGLLILLMIKNHIEIPPVWKTYLTAMSEFVSDSTDDTGVTMEFGDSDEGKILDLKGVVEDHYQYVLNLMSCLLDQSYTDVSWHENLEWIVPQELRKKKERYIPGLVCSRKDGGYTFLRSKDRRVMIGIDHADLGFGSIAAHGHADALSFQLCMDGNPVFIDSGTFNYHITPEHRNYYRSTAAHNTVMINGHEQSEMLGPFLWGKRAECTLLKSEDGQNGMTVVAEHDGYAPVIHHREFQFDGKRKLQITDTLSMSSEYTANFLFAPQMKLMLEGKLAYFNSANVAGVIRFKCDDAIRLIIKEAMCSMQYGEQEASCLLCVIGKGQRFVTEITIKESNV